MISCETHDYIEIACTYRYEVIILMKSGEKIAGIALDTGLNSDRDECLTLETANGVVQVVLNDAVSMSTDLANPHFDLIKFS